MKLVLDTLIKKPKKPAGRPQRRVKRQARPTGAPRVALDLDALLARIAATDPLVEHASEPDPVPNIAIKTTTAKPATLPGYKLRMEPQDLTALGGVLQVADMPIHTALRALVERLDGAIGKRTVVDAARAKGVFYSCWSKNGRGRNDLYLPAELLAPLRQSVSAVLAKPTLLSSWIGPDADTVRNFALALTPSGMKQRMETGGA